MKRILGIILTTVIFCSSCVNNDKLVGAWLCDDGDSESDYTFNQDGTYSFHIASKSPYFKFEHWEKGTYEHKGDSIIFNQENFTQTTNGLKSGGSVGDERHRLSAKIIELTDTKVVVDKNGIVNEYKKEQ